MEKRHHSFYFFHRECHLHLSVCPCSHFWLDMTAFCLPHCFMCQLIPPLSWHVLCWLLRKLCCTACCFSDMCDKKRHEVSPGQAPHADGEWTQHIWLFGVNQTSTINACLCPSLLHRKQLYFKKACISHAVWCCVVLNALFPDCFFVFLHLLQQEGEIRSMKRGLHALFFHWRS